MENKKKDGIEGRRKGTNGMKEREKGNRIDDSLVEAVVHSPHERQSTIIVIITSGYYNLLVFMPSV